MQSILLKTKRQILLFQGLIHAASEPYQGSLKLVTAGHRWLNACPVFLPESVNYRWERNELNPTFGGGSPHFAGCNPSRQHGTISISRPLSLPLLHLLPTLFHIPA